MLICPNTLKLEAGQIISIFCIMDDLIEIVHQLSTVEIAQLKKELKADKQKLKLLEYLLVTDEIQNEEIIEVLNYQNNKSAYYTFKHRLLHDIIQFKFNVGKNKVIKLREEIDNLRSLLYSNQPRLLEKKLNDLAKRSMENDLYAGIREVYLCQYLLHYHDAKKRAQYQELYREAHENEMLFSDLEFLFYEAVFRSHDHYFNQFIEEEEFFNQTLAKMQQIHKKLNSSISHFVYESTLLTIKLNNRKSTNPDYLPRARKLLIEYLNSTLQYHYPNCRFAILCLIAKFYSNMGLYKEFEEVIMELENDLSEIRGYRTYEDVYFFYLHSKTEIFLRKKEYQELYLFMNDEISDIAILSASNKSAFYLLYLKGVANYYGGHFSKAYSYLLKARNYTKYLEEGSRWVLIQTSIFALMVLSRETNYQLIDSEKKYLKRQVKKTGISENPVSLFLELLNVKVKNKKRSKLEDILRRFNEIQEENPPYRLIDCDYFLKN